MEVHFKSTNRLAPKFYDFIKAAVRYITESRLPFTVMCSY